MLLMGSAQPVHRAHGQLTACLCLLLLGCEPGSLVEPTAATPGPAPFIISDTAIVSQAGLYAASSAASQARVFVSLPPGTIAGGEVATIRHPDRGILAQVELLNGGFDPVGVEALGGESLQVTVRRRTLEPLEFFLLVPAVRRPVIVRAEPPPRRRDVPLNVRVQLVFSEPIDPVTVTPVSVMLLHDGDLVPSDLLLSPDQLKVEILPDQPLDPMADYEVRVTSAVRDLDGQTMEHDVTISFTTDRAVADRLVFSVAPAGTRHGLMMSPFVEVVAQDASGNTVTSFDDTVRLSVALAAPAIVTLSGVVAVRAVNGVARFPGVMALGELSLFSLRARSDEMTAESRAILLSPAVASELFRVAYAVCLDPSCSESTLHLMNGDGTDPAQVPTPAGAADDFPAWSFNGLRLAFSRRRCDTVCTTHIVVRDSLGQEQTIAGGSGSLAASEPAWSPDGTRLLFVAEESDGETNIYVMNADGTGRVRLSGPAGDDHEPQWSPDGRRIAFLNLRRAPNLDSASLYVMNADGTNLRAVHHLVSQDGIFRFLRSPRWHPDSRRLLVVSVSTSDDAANRRMSIVDADGTPAIRLSVPARDAAWTADGERVIVSHDDIRVMSFDGSGVRVLSSEVGFHLAWSPQPRPR